jgi:hypothetical protein
MAITQALDITIKSAKVLLIDKLETYWFYQYALLIFRERKIW